MITVCTTAIRNRNEVDRLFANDMAYSAPKYGLVGYYLKLGYVYHGHGENLHKQ